MRTIIPVKDNVLVQQDKPEEKTEGGLFMPQGARETYKDIGTVIAVGPGRTTEDGETIPVSVQVGERVLFKRRPASALEGEWDGLLLLKDDDILGVLEATEPEPPTGSV
jgi:chaperonin GroES